jgi:transposase
MMTLYNHFVGIDIGKFSFVVAVHGQKQTKEYDNDASGIKSFIKDYQKYLSKGLCVLETTGGYEMRLLLTLCEGGYSVHRANTRKVKHFIRSFGNSAKTDPLDGKGLALYGYERSARLECFTPQSSQALALYELVQRRQDLKRLLVAEKNRLKAPRANLVQESCRVMIETINQQVLLITGQINTLIEQDPVLKAKKEVLKSIPGIGDITANELVVLLPELGTLSRRQIASLAGVAPIANDSGTYKGYRATGHGRSDIKPILFMSAMAARNSNSSLKSFYNRLIEAGKKKMVAITALMRKIIVIANARLKSLIQIEA